MRRREEETEYMKKVDDDLMMTMTRGWEEKFESR
jgi:hypothetical protein